MEWTYLVKVLWENKWRILIPIFIVVLITGVVSFVLPQKWEVDVIISPSKFLVQTEQGQFEEVIVVDPKQVVGQINQKSYDRMIADELKIDIKEFPDFKAEKLTDTNLVRVVLKEKDVNKGKSILATLFDRLKRDFDKKIDIEIKGLDSEITTLENQIKKKELDIQSEEINKEKVKQQIGSAENKRKISEDRYQSITEEMKAVKKRIDDTEAHQKKALDEIKQGLEALSLLLYSNEIQTNLRYYNSLDEKLSTEKVTQENLKLMVKENNEEIKRLSTDIKKLKREIDDLNNQIRFINERKGRIDYAQLVKVPTSSLNPVFPNKKLNIAIAFILGLIVFTPLAFFLHALERQKELNRSSS